MNAGRELDALIATKVMDWSIDDDGEIWHGGVYLRDLNQWRPSTNIGHAWVVVERLMALGNGIHLCGFGSEFRAMTLTGQWTAWTDSAPLAICDAALELFGLKKAA